MAWEKRGASSYYYRSVRDPDGRVRRLYLGTEHSPAAQLAANQDAERRAQQQTDRAARLAEREHQEAAEAPLRQLCKQTDMLMKAALLAAGFHQHARCTWRRKRHGCQPEGQ
jgi:hypothetical protein